MNKLFGLTILGAGFFLAGCQSLVWEDTGVYYAVYDVTPPTAQTVTVCRAYNCRIRSQMHVSSADLDTIRAGFASARTPAAERVQMANAIGLLEKRAGVLFGTDTDKAGVLYNEGIGDPTQQDCVDEAATATGYLELMAQNGFFKFHTVQVPTVRGMLIDGRWQHFAARVRVNATSTEYVIDSWFRPNGQPAVVMEHRAWLTDYTSAASKQLPQSEI